MTRADVNHTQVVRDWLAVGAQELSPRVLENVLREFPGTNQDRPHWAASWPQFSSFAFGAAAGAAMALIVAVAAVGAGLWPGYQRGGTAATATPTPDIPTSPTPRPTLAPSPTPDTIDRSYREVGINGLHPRGMTPSDPTLTELIETFWRPGPPYKGAAFLYEDGRLIWNEYFGEVNFRSTGWLEQSLTDEGIELVRALASEELFLGQMQWILSPEELPGLLPDSAWANREVRPYVPSGYAACLFMESGMTHQEMLAALPRAATDLLRDRPPVMDSSESYAADHDCLGLDVADARRLDAALRAAGFEQDGLMYNGVLDRPEAGTWWLSVWYEPILPDGTITCSNCG